MTGIVPVILIVKSMVIVMKILFILNVIQTLTAHSVPTVAQMVFVTNITIWSAILTVTAWSIPIALPMACVTVGNSA